MTYWRLGARCQLCGLGYPTPALAGSPLRLAQAGSGFLGSLSCLAGAHLGILCAFLGPLSRLG